MLKISYYLTIIGITLSVSAFAQSTTVQMFSTTTDHVQAGTIQITETPYGLLFMPTLQGLKPELHGFHIHTIPSCDDNGMAAGGHLDPKNTQKHLGPYNDGGHLGDLPVLSVTQDGRVTLPVLAPRLMHLTDIRNHSLMIHEGGDNYSDTPLPLGGGGARMYCGIIQK